MNHEGKKIIVHSAEGTRTSSAFRNDAKPGSIAHKFEKESEELRLKDIVANCPEGFLPTLLKLLEEIRIKHNATERELVIAADAILASRNGYINNEVKNPITTSGEAIQKVRDLLRQQESNIIQ